ncbi:MAG: DNA methyltransferase [Phycisphaerae bacterium]|nr:DNA methyltransferase [Phycisphaerae bacterium]
MQTKVISADSVIPYARNPRKNSAAVDKVAASIKEFGWRQPIVVDKENVIIAGHTRLLAAQKLGMDEVPVHVADLTDAQAKAYRLADNRIAEDADWDIDLLGLEIRELDDLGFELDLTGFDNTELANLLIDPDLGETDEDAVPEPPEEPISKPGDLWILGEHRLLCGDSTSEDDVARLMDGKSCGVVLADPPYGMNLDADYSGMISLHSLHKGKKHEDVIGDDVPFDVGAVKGVSCCEDQFWFGADYYKDTLPSGGSWMVWDKRLDESADKMFGSCFELIWQSVKRKRLILRYKWAGFFTNGEERSFDHPTTKSVRLLVHIIEISSGVGFVFDPFLGSGSTLIACEQLNRKCYGMEIDPLYCDVVVKRWEEYTGEQATLQQRKAA